jgi:hypothetical protein
MSILRRLWAIAATVALGAASARADSWEVDATWGNDLFTELIPPIDDSGFTNDLGLALRQQRGALVVGGSIRHRMITEVFGRRRWDQLELFATAERRWSYVDGGARLGPSFAGSLGGRAIQNTWHRITRSGPTLDEGLQSDYDGDHRIALIAGIDARAHIGAPLHQLYIAADAQLALGSTGVSWLEVAAGARVAHDLRRVRLGAHGEVAASRFSVDDPNLVLRGGYGTDGTQLSYRVGVDVAWSRYQLAYTYRANEGGSGEPFGVVELIVRR